MDLDTVYFTYQLSKNALNIKKLLKGYLMNTMEENA